MNNLDILKGLELCRFNNHNHTKGEVIKFNTLAKLVSDPPQKRLENHDKDTVDAEKRTLPLITPFVNKDTLGKTGNDALTAQYSCIVVDFDHEASRTIDAIACEIATDYEDVAHIAFTTSSHSLNGENAFKFIFPLAESVDVHQHEALAKGMMLMFDTDEAQARKHQGFYAPCDMLEPSVYASRLHLENCSPLSPDSVLWGKAVQAYLDDIEHKQQEARAIPSKPKPSNTPTGATSILEMINRSYGMQNLLESAGHKRIAKKWLSPHSQSGIAGGLVFDNNRFYSHSSSCPLGAVNNGGHSLDVADVLCITQYGGDMARMIKDEANKLDQQGQKQRQREFVQSQNGTAYRGPDDTAEMKNNLESTKNSTDKTDKTPTTEKPTAWGEVQKIDNSLLPVQKLTPEMLPQEIADYCFDVANLADNSTPDSVAIAVLTTLGAALGAKVGIRPKQKVDNWEVVSNLWGGIVAPPSSKKSPLLSAGRTFIDGLEANEAKKVEAEQKQYKFELKKLDLDIKTLNKKIDVLTKQQAQLEEPDDSVTKDIDDLITQIMDKEEERDEKREPQAKRFITDDSSPEKLAELESVNPDGMLVFRDELVGLLQSLERNGEDTGRTFYMEGYNGTGSYKQDRIGRGSITIENHCISVLGGIQPDKITGYIEQQIKGNSNDGLLQRFQLLVYPDALQWENVDRYPNHEAKKQLRKIYESFANFSEGKLIAMGAKKTEYDKRPYFRFTPEAYELFTIWREHLNTETKPNEQESILVEHLGKYESLVAKIALIFHLIECELLGIKGNVNASCVEMALQWISYLESHARRIYGLVLNTHNMRAGNLLSKIKSLNPQGDWAVNGFTARELERKNWKGLTDSKYISHALDVLEKANYIAVQEIPPSVTGGRPTKRYWINLKIYS